MDELFYPPPDSQYSKWLKNFTPKATALATIIGFTPAEIEKLTLITNALVFSDERASTYDYARYEFVRTRQIILNGDDTNPILGDVTFEAQPAVEAAPPVAPANSRAFITNLVQRTRVCPTITEMKKKEMGVLPKPRPVPEVQAVLQGEVVNGQPVLEVKLYGTNGFEVWRSLTGTNEFAYFDRSASNTYTDASPLPEGLLAVQYDYKARLVGSDNVPVSDFSNVLTLTKTA